MVRCERCLILKWCNNISDSKLIFILLLGACNLFTLITLKDVLLSVCVCSITVYIFYYFKQRNVFIYILSSVKVLLYMFGVLKGQNRYFNMFPVCTLLVLQK